MESEFEAVLVTDIGPGECMAVSAALAEAREEYYRELLRTADTDRPVALRRLYTTTVYRAVVGEYEYRATYHHHAFVDWERRKMK